MNNKDIIFEKILEELKESGFGVLKDSNEEHRLLMNFGPIKIGGTITGDLNDGSVLFSLVLSAKVIDINKERLRKAVVMEGLDKSTMVALGVTFPKRGEKGPAGLLVQYSIIKLSEDNCKIVKTLASSLVTFRNITEFFCSDKDINWSLNTELEDVYLKAHIINGRLVKEIQVRNSLKGEHRISSDIFRMEVDLGIVDDIEDIEEQLKSYPDNVTDMFESNTELWGEVSETDVIKSDNCSKKKNSDIKGLSLD